MVSCWHSTAIVGCWWSNNELQRQRLLVAVNCTSVFPEAERQYFRMIDGQSKELDHTTSAAFDIGMLNSFFFSKFEF